MLQDSDYHYSITVLVEDLPVLYCLRGLSMYSQEAGNVYKPWKRAARKVWEQHHHIVRFYFSSPEFRQHFESIPGELLGGRWEKVGDSDDDPLPSEEA